MRGRVDLTGSTLVYRAAAGVTDVVIISLTKSIAAGGYYLVTGPTFGDLGAPDQSYGSGHLAAAGGGVGLRDSAQLLVDSVGYGTATNAFVESAAAPAPPERPIDRAQAERQRHQSQRGRLRSPRRRRRGRRIDTMAVRALTLNAVSSVRASLVVLAVMVVAATPGRARAESAEAQVERLAAEAVNAYRVADYNRAVELLSRAYDIRQVPALLYNMAKAYDKLGDIDRACEIYRRYADSADADPRLKAKAEARLVILEDARRKKKAAERPVEPKPQAPPPAVTPPPQPAQVEPPKPAAPTAEEVKEQLKRDRQRSRRRDRYVALGLGVGAVALRRRRRRLLGERAADCSPTGRRSSAATRRRDARSRTRPSRAPPSPTGSTPARSSPPASAPTSCIAGFVRSRRRRRWRCCPSPRRRARRWSRRGPSDAARRSIHDGEPRRDQLLRAAHLPRVQRRHRLQGHDRRRRPALLQRRSHVRRRHPGLFVVPGLAVRPTARSPPARSSSAGSSAPRAPTTSTITPSATPPISPRTSSSPRATTWHTWSATPPAIPRKRRAPTTSSSIASAPR